MEKFLDEVQTCTTGVDYVLMNTKEPLDAVLGSYLTFRHKVRRSARHAAAGNDQITSTKSQTNPNNQFQMNETMCMPVLVIGAWSLDIVCDLMLGA